jgi:hypothetical protein
MDSTEFLLPEEAARFLRLSDSTLAKMRCTGGGPRFLKLGRKVVYRRDDLLAWANAQGVTSTSAHTAKAPR